MTNIMSEEQTPPTPTTPETDSKYFSFTFDEENKTASITGINEAYKSEDGVIVDGDTRITSIVIPGSVKNSGEDYTVTSVASGSFMECALEEVTIPDSVTVINGYAFSLCTALTKLTIGSGVTIIGSNAFSNCTALEEVTIPDSVTEIGGSAFPGCTALKKLTIGSGVTKIGGSAFAMCTTLEEIIYLGLSAPTFETNVFYNVSVKYVQVPKEYEDSTFGRFSIMRLD